ncbi:MAG: PPOX class F420-dependent oxidoreductase [Thermoleophilia bacterium]
MFSDALRDHSTVALTTFRRDGSEAESLVSVAVTDDGRAVFRTYAETWKARRLRRDPRVRVTPTTFRGHPVAPAIPARARRLDGSDAAAARRALARRHPFLHGVAVPVVHRLRGLHTQHYELLPPAGGGR